MKILVIRRDNIGDLICTTPLMRALREAFPQARIDALVNTYNEPVLRHNPDLDNVYAYIKGKHRPAGMSLWRAWWETLRLVLRLRREHYDFVILGQPVFQRQAMKFARVLNAGKVVGYTGSDEAAVLIDHPVQPDPAARHEVEHVMQLLKPFGVQASSPRLRLQLSPAEQLEAKSLRERCCPEGGELVAVHISARKPSQRWPESRFPELMRELAGRENVAFLLFWSPGSENNPLHPGDDEKAQRILEAAHDVRISAYSTSHLRELMVGLSACDRVICSDGGAMHVAAALDKPMAVMFGKSDASRWHPWGVPHRVLQAESQDVKDVPVESVLQALQQLSVA